MKVKNARTVATLHADYAARIADAVGLTVTKYAPTVEGLAGLLRDATTRLSPLDPNLNALDEAASYLDAVALLDDSPRVTNVLRTVDSTLWEVVGELETC
jgi:hypothetical protein